MRFLCNPYMTICALAVFAVHAGADIPSGLHSSADSVDTLPCASNILVGVRHMYNLDFDEAEKVFNAVIQSTPEHPVGYVYCAYLSLLRQMVGGNSRVAQTQFTNYLSCAMACAFRPDAQCTPRFRLYRGIALVMQAQHVAEKGDYLSAMQWGKRGLHEISSAASYPDTHSDANALLGMYHYFIADAPWYVRTLSSVMLLPPDAVYGMRSLEEGAEKSVIIQTEAKISLAVAYLREGMSTRSLSYVNELAALYTNNMWIDILRQDALLSVKNSGSAIKAAQKNLDRIQNDTRPWMRGLLIDQHYALGRYHQMTTNYPDALIHYEKAATQPAKKPRLKALARLHQGMIFDCLGQRQHARNAYATVQSMPVADPYVVQQAAVYMLRPYDGKEMLSGGGGL